MKKAYGIVALILINVFFLIDIVGAQAGELIKARQVNYLSPVVQINSQPLINGFQRLISKIVIKDELPKYVDSKISSSETMGSREGWFNKLTSKEQRVHIANGLSLETPFRVEVHPYHISQKSPCNNNCVWCTKGDEKNKLKEEKIEGIKLENLLKFIEVIGAMGVTDMAISGNSTEPLMYEGIAEVLKKIKEEGMNFRLFSNFYYGERIKEVIPKLQAGDVIRVSLDAASSDSYNKTHVPLDPKAYDKILDNLKDVSQERDRAGVKFSLHITFLLTKTNFVQEEIGEFIKWALENKIDTIRFSVPLKPEVGNDKFDEKMQLTNKEIEEARKFLMDMQKKYPKYSKNIIITTELPEQAEKTFKQCHHWKMIAVLGATGKFFPCTSVSLVEGIASLGREDINASDFNFIEFWNDTEKWKDLDPQSCLNNKCADCTRWEFIVNQRIDAIRKHMLESNVVAIDKIVETNSDLALIGQSI